MYGHYFLLAHSLVKVSFRVAICHRNNRLKFVELLPYLILNITRIFYKKTLALIPIVAYIVQRINSVW